MKRITLKSSRTILNLGKFFACIPSDETTHWTYRMFYPMIMLILNVATAAISFYGRMKHMQHIEKTSYSLALASDVILICCTVIRIVVINYLCNKEKIMMEDHLRNLEATQLKLKNEEAEYSRLEIVSMHFGFGLFIACNLTIILTSLSWYTWYFIIREFTHYQVLISTSVMKTYMKIIHSNYQYINEVLNTLKPTSLFISDMSMNNNYKFNIEWISKQYMKLWITIRLFNKVYGVYMVCIYIYITINLLVPFNLAIVYGGGYILEDGKQFGPYFGLMAIVWSVLPAVSFKKTCFVDKKR